MAAKADTNIARMSLQEAVTLAGSFEALLPHLVGRPLRILAWHNGSYVCGVSMLQVGTISPKTWAQARNVDVKTNRVYMRDDLFYIDVELERAAVARRSGWKSASIKVREFRRARDVGRA